MIKISRTGQVTSWLSQDDARVFISQIRTQEGVILGGCFAMAPTTETNKSVPELSVLRALDDVSIKGHLIKRDPDDAPFTIKLNFPATTHFPWWYQVELQIRAESDSSALMQTILVTRHEGCQNQEPMPLSFGFHPYFATNGQTFTIAESKNLLFEGNNSRLKKTKLLLGYATAERESIVLDRPDDEIIITGTDVFEWIGIKSDDLLKYVCITLMSSARFLQPNQTLTGSCFISYRKK